MNGQKAIQIIMNAVKELAFETFLPCEIKECGSRDGRRYRTPIGLRCEACLGKVLTSALENGGRFWTCRCPTNAQPCVEYKGKGITRWGPTTCQHSPCAHLPGCHYPGIRFGESVSAWLNGLRKVAA